MYMRVFIAIDCHAHTITIAIHARFLLASILAVLVSAGRIYVKM